MHFGHRTICNFNDGNAISGIVTCLIKPLDLRIHFLGHGKSRRIILRIDYL